MKDKINVAELLKDCPQGMELDCTMYDNLYFDSSNADYYGTINCYTLIDGIKTSINFTKYGTFNNYIGAKCVIFPKGKTSWEGFVPPCKFKDGDIVFYNDTIAIFKEWGDETLFRTYVTKYLCCDFCIDVNVPLFGKSVRREIRFATEEEKENLFTAIKEQGYKWNAETKTLEKLIVPKFKVGDVIQDIDSYRVKITNVCVEDEMYGYESVIAKGIGGIGFDKQDEWELIPNKFDITTLVPFESRVLVRDSNNGSWCPSFFGCCKKDNCLNCLTYNTIRGFYKQCIPFEGNEHLLGTTNDCSDFYKTWE